MKRFLIPNALSTEKDASKKQKAEAEGSASNKSEYSNLSDKNLKNNEHKRKHANKFSPLWLLDPNLKNWLIEMPPKSNIPHCKICDQTLKACGGKRDLFIHAKTEKHLKLLLGLQKQPTISNSLSQNIPRNKKASLELKIAAFCVENNLPFSATDHLVNLIKCIPDNETAKSITGGRTKVTCIVKNVLAQQQFENLTKNLQETKFSVCIDESTDLSTWKHLSVVVRLHSNFKVNDYFFSLIKMSKSDADSIYNALISIFNANNINYKKNLIGYAADGANVMCGKNHSVARLLKDDCPHLFILRCVCHSFSLCASYACMKLPNSIEKLTREIFNYIQNSPKRSEFFSKIQIILELKPKKLLHPHQIRWLSLEAVVNRILELFEPLKIYFAFVANIDKIHEVRKLLNLLEDPTTKLYYEFLKYILFYVNNLNRLFQSEAPEIFKLHSELGKIVLTIIDNFMLREYIDSTPLYLINPNDSSKYLETDSIYLGGAVEYSLSLLKEKASYNKEAINEFKIHCRDFYVELVVQIFKRFNFQDEIMKDFDWLHPKVVISKERKTITNFCKHFPNLIASVDIPKIDEEWRDLRNFDFFTYKLDENTDVETFWATILKSKRMSNNFAFPMLKNFVFELLSLPNSSAVVERTFSQINLNKTKVRNKLATDTLNAILLTKDYLRREGIQCFDVEINSDISQKMKSKNLYG